MRRAPTSDPAGSVSAAQARALPPLSAAVAPVLIDLSRLPEEELLAQLGRLQAGAAAVAAEIATRVRRMELATRDALAAAHMAERLSAAEAARELKVSRSTAYHWVSRYVRLDVNGKATRQAWQEAQEQARLRMVAPGRALQQARLQKTRAVAHA